VAAIDRKTDALRAELGKARQDVIKAEADLRAAESARSEAGRPTAPGSPPTWDHPPAMPPVLRGGSRQPARDAPFHAEAEGFSVDEAADGKRAVKMLSAAATRR
jgi:hypothetical protein